MIELSFQYLYLPLFYAVMIMFDCMIAIRSNSKLKKKFCVRRRSGAGRLGFYNVLMGSFTYTCIKPRRNLINSFKILTEHMLGNSRTRYTNFTHPHSPVRKSILGAAACKQIFPSIMYAIFV